MILKITYWKKAAGLLAFPLAALCLFSSAVPASGRSYSPNRIGDYFMCKISSLVNRDSWLNAGQGIPGHTAIASTETENTVQQPDLATVVSVPAGFAAWMVAQPEDNVPVSEAYNISFAMPAVTSPSAIQKLRGLVMNGTPVQVKEILKAHPGLVALAKHTIHSGISRETIAREIDSRLSAGAFN
jgi:hypothetical protein